MNYGRLAVRVVKSIPLEDLPHAIAIGLQSGFGDDFLKLGGIKAFSDGALGPRTAAMLQPYDGEPENRGMLLLDREELAEYRPAGRRSWPQHGCARNRRPRQSRSAGCYGSDTGT